MSVVRERSDGLGCCCRDLRGSTAVDDGVPRQGHCLGVRDGDGLEKKVGLASWQRDPKRYYKYLVPGKQIARYPTLKQLGIFITGSQLSAGYL